MIREYSFVFFDLEQNWAFFNGSNIILKFENFSCKLVFLAVCEADFTSWGVRIPWRFVGGSEMKIKIESDKITKAVKKLDGIEIVLENADDAKEAVKLILRKTDLFQMDEYGKFKDVKVTSFRSYETSSVDYKLIFLLEFLFEEDVPLDSKISVIKELYQFFEKI